MNQLYENLPEEVKYKNSINSSGQRSLFYCNVYYHLSNLVPILVAPTSISIIRETKTNIHIF
jgi:hypothetical protein